jgi:hypothetical protein
MQIKSTDTNSSNLINKDVLPLDESKCPICKLGDGVLCLMHMKCCKSFDWIKNYLNNLEKFDKNTLYIIDVAVADRKQNFINVVGFVKGHLALEEYMEKESCPAYKEKEIKEILILEKAKAMIINIMKKEEAEINANC